jgi:hypothetical protein
MGRLVGMVAVEGEQHRGGEMAGEGEECDGGVVAGQQVRGRVDALCGELRSQLPRSGCSAARCPVA